MKTTVEISDALLEEAKQVAADESITLRELVEAGLRAVLRERRSRRGDFRAKDARVDGRGVRPELRGAGWARIRDAAHEEPDA